MTVYPDLLEGVIDPVVQGVIRGYCEWHIAPSVTETFVLDGPGLACMVVLPTLHVTAVTAILVDGVALDLSAVIWYENGLLFGDFGETRRGVSVTATHGYVGTPSELEAVAERLTTPIPVGGTVRVGDVSVSGGPSNSAGFDPYCSAILDRYRLPRRP